MTLTVNGTGSPTIATGRIFLAASSKPRSSSCPNAARPRLLARLWWSSSLQVLRYQTLNPDPERPSPDPISSRPQLAFSGRLPTSGATPISASGQFSRSSIRLGRGQPARRLSPARAAYIDPAFIVMPKFGLHATQYSLDRQAAGTPSSLTAWCPPSPWTVRWSSSGRRGSAATTSNPGPRLYYVYIPTGIGAAFRLRFRPGDFNFAQIFTENRYTGFDRVNDANQLTAGVTTPFRRQHGGRKRFRR